MKEKYLISASNAYAAKEIASNMNLNVYENIHIKANDGWPIRKSLLGKKISHMKYLVGYFSEKEKQHLLGVDLIGYHGKYSKKRKIKKDQQIN